MADMVVKEELKGVKVVLKLSEGSQTISDCRLDATNEQLYKLGTAVGKLEAKTVKTMTKVVESALINEQACAV